MLKDHAGLATDALDVPHVVSQFDAVYDDRAALMFFEAVDGANKGGLARPARTEDDDHFAFLHVHINAAQSLELPEPFMHVATRDYDCIVFLFAHVFQEIGD